MLELVTGSGVTVSESANTARELFNQVEDYKQIVFIQTTCKDTRYCETVIWYVLNVPSQPESVKQTKKFIGMENN